MEEILLTIAVFAVAMGLLWVGLLRSGKNGAIHGHAADESGATGCRFCGSNGIGLCPKDSAESRALFRETAGTACGRPFTDKQR